MAVDLQDLPLVALALVVGDLAWVRTAPWGLQVPLALGPSAYCQPLEALLVPSRLEQIPWVLPLAGADQEGSHPALALVAWPGVPSCGGPSSYWPGPA